MTPALSGFRNLRRSFYRTGVTGWKFERTLIFVSLDPCVRCSLMRHMTQRQIETLKSVLLNLILSCVLKYFDMGTQGSCGFEPVRVKRHLRVFD